MAHLFLPSFVTQCSPRTLRHVGCILVLLAGSCVLGNSTYGSLPPVSLFVGSDPEELSLALNMLLRGWERAWHTLQFQEQLQISTTLIHDVHHNLTSTRRNPSKSLPHNIAPHRLKALDQLATLYATYLQRNEEYEHFLSYITQYRSSYPRAIAYIEALRTSLRQQTLQVVPDLGAQLYHAIDGFTPRGLTSTLSSAYAVHTFSRADNYYSQELYNLAGAYEGAQRAGNTLWSSILRIRMQGFKAAYEELYAYAERHGTALLTRIVWNDDNQEWRFSEYALPQPHVLALR